MSIARELRNLIEAGTHRIGQIEILTDVDGHDYVLCHHEDLDQCRSDGFGGLEHHRSPTAARDISTYAEDGTYRFTKGQTNLKHGWVLTLRGEEQLRQALDLFYPAAIALFLAKRDATLEVQNLRDKLGRQTGMYRYAGTVSNEGAQQLIKDICGPANQCAKRILWKIDPDTPLDDSQASRFDGIPDGLEESEAIPLLCREACNFFVSECRKLAKKEFESNNS